MKFQDHCEEQPVCTTRAELAEATDWDTSTAATGIVQQAVLATHTESAQYRLKGKIFYVCL